MTPTIADKLATDQPSDCQKGTNKDLEFQWNVSGATRLGKIRTENQDSFTIWRESVSQIFIAANDGAGGIDGGREASQSAAESALAVMEYTAGSNLSPRRRLEMAIAEARETAKAEKLNGITTAILTYCENDKLHYATLGDGAVVAVWPDGMVSHIQTPHHILGQPDNVIAAYIGQGCEIKPRTGSIRLEPGRTIMLMTDGASELFPYDDFAHNRLAYSEALKQKDNSDLADHLLKQIEEARDPETDAYLHHDNMTLVLAHISSKDHHHTMASVIKEKTNA